MIDVEKEVKSDNSWILRGGDVGMVTDAKWSWMAASTRSFLASRALSVGITERKSARIGAASAADVVEVDRELGVSTTARVTVVQPNSAGVRKKEP
jgi:hypothetical protein